MNRLRFAVAGAGYIGQAHIDAVQHNEHCTLCAIVDPAPGAAATAAKSGVPLYARLQDLLATDRPDAVILATPNQFHVDHALVCIDAGLPMLLEKPIAPTVTEARQLIAATDKASARLLIGHHRAHSPIMARTTPST